MSLVGNLEDLGLGDILQIVSLARKSGILSLRGGDVRGRIIFKDGLVVAALSSEERHNLAQLLEDHGKISPEKLDDAIQESNRTSSSLKEILWSRDYLPRPEIEELVKEKVEDVVFSFFNWPEGNFSFELTEVDPEIRNLKSPWCDFVLERGLSPQYLAMEGTRRHDERKRADEEAPVGPPPVSFTGELAVSPKSEKVATEDDFSSVGEFASHTSPGVAVEEKQEQPAEQEALVKEPFRQQEPFEEMRPKEEMEPAPPLPEKAQGGPGILIVDDEPLLLESVKYYLVKKGFQVYAFASSREGLEKWRELKHSHSPFVILADLIMPASDENNVLGGLELLKKVRTEDNSVQFWMMTDYENKIAEEQARRTGADYYFYKPKSSQLDLDYSSPELLNFVAVLMNALQSMTPAQEEPEETEEKKEALFDLAEELSKELGDEDFGLRAPPEEPPSRGITMLKTMINELNDPSSSGQITLLVLRFAAEMMNRAVIFLVAKNQLAGLGQFGIELDGKDPEQQVRRIRIPLNEPSIFQETLRKRMPLKKPLKNNKWNNYLVQRLGGVEPEEVFVAPIISSGRIAAILYGDNVPEKREIGDTESLEIFLAQAGLAMEKALLERRLSELRSEGPTGSKK